jgi:Creatinine amidohydrolase
VAKSRCWSLRRRATAPPSITWHFRERLRSSPVTFLGVVQAICRSLARHGLRRQLVLNGHGGNRALLAEAVQQLGFEQPVRIAALDYWAVAREAAGGVRELPPGGMAHACEFETSLNAPPAAGVGAARAGGARDRGARCHGGAAGHVPGVGRSRCTGRRTS